jgi:hypothetical protein
MSTQKNTDNSRASNSTAKCNYNAIQYGNDHGRIAFGKVHKKADVTSSVMLEAKDGRHKFYMDHDGQRKGWTTLSSPGSIQMRCGHDLKEEEDGFFLEAINGDIDIIATNGKIRLQANDIELVTVGGDTDAGHIKMTASESITMDAKKIIATGKNLVRLATPNTLDLVANGQMKFISGVCRAATNGSAQKDSKYNHKFFNDKEFSTTP